MQLKTSNLVTGQLADKPTRGQITRGLDNSRTGQLVDWITRGYTGQLADWSTRGLDNSRTFNFYRRPRGDDSRNSVDISRKRTAVLCLFKIKI